MSSLSPSAEFPAIDPGNFAPIKPVTPIHRGYLCAITGFIYLNVGTSLAAALMGRPTETLAVTMPAPGSIISLSAALTGARSAGSLTLEAYKNATATGMTVSVDSVGTQFVASSPAIRTGFGIGDRLDVRLTSTSDWAPTTADLEATIWVEIEGSTQPPAAPGGSSAP